MMGWFALAAALAAAVPPADADTETAPGAAETDTAPDLLPPPASTDVGGPVAADTATGEPSTAVPLEGAQDTEDADAPWDPSVAEQSLPDTDTSAVLAQARHLNAQALSWLHRKRPRAALALLEQAYSLAPQDAEIVNNLGYVHWVLKNYEEAEGLLRESVALDDTRPVALLNLADVLLHEPTTYERVREAAGLLERARVRLGPLPKLLWRQAQAARRLGNPAQAERFLRTYMEVAAPSNAVLLALGDVCRDQGRFDEARQWYQKVRGAKAAVAKQRMWELEVERQNIEFGWTPKLVPPRAREAVRRGRSALATGDTDAALHWFRTALRMAPTFGDALVGMGDAWYRLGEVDKAELAYLKALVMHRDDPDVYAKLGRMLLRSARDDRAAEAALYLERAVTLRPDWIGGVLDLAIALRKTGDLAGAWANVVRFLKKAPAGHPDRRVARSLYRELRQLRGRHAFRSGVQETSHPVPERLRDALKRTRAYLAAGKFDRAMAVLRSLPEALRDETVLSLEARILLAAGRYGAAADVLRSALRRNPAQPLVHERLAMIYEQQGAVDRAVYHLRRARALGDTGAAFLLARLLVESHLGDGGIWRDLWHVATLWRARDFLRDYFAADTAHTFRTEARALQEQVERRIARAAAVGGTACLLLIAGLVWVVARRYLGASLAVLVARHPRTAPTVQQILASIRHEVLKHNTMTLTGLVDAIERGDGDREAHLSYLGTRLLEPESGVLYKLEHYITELHRLGRSVHVRLNLRRRDPVIRPLWRGFRLLMRHARVLRDPRGLSPRRLHALGRDCRRALRLLNDQAYPAIGELLSSLRALEIDGEAIRALIRRCAQEPALSAVAVADPVVEFRPADIEPVRVPIIPVAFVDLFTNLVRNALQASSAAGLSPVPLLVRVEVQADPITAVSYLELSLSDQAPTAIPPQALSDREGEGGLAIAVRIAAEYGGYIDVQPQDPPWVKAVVVHLPVTPVTG